MLKKFDDTELENCSLFFLKRTGTIPAHIINPCTTGTTGKTLEHSRTLYTGAETMNNININV